MNKMRLLDCSLYRDSTFRCGENERFVVNYLRDQLRKFRRTVPVLQLFYEFKKTGGNPRDFFKLLRRLQDRKILKLSKEVRK